MKTRIFLIIAMIGITIQLSALTAPDISNSFNWNEQAARPGTLSHYIMTHNSVLNPKTPATDYWVYQSAPYRLEVLYDETGLGIGTGLWLETWTLKPEKLQFDRCIRRNLREIPNQPQISHDILFDLGASGRRTQYITVDKGVSTINSNLETMPWQPMLWHRDLGIWFIAFFPHLNPATKPFTICMDSWNHLLFTSVISTGKETIAGVVCNKYRLEAQGLLSMLINNGAVWVSADETPRVMRQEININLSWTLPQLQCQLSGQTQITPSEWGNLQAKIKGN